VDEPEKIERFDADSSWKDLIGRFLYPLLKRAIPELYEAADTKTEPRFLDKEFTDVLNTPYPDIHTSPHFADYLMEIPLKDGKAEWILCHFEAQGLSGGDLPERMSHYHCLIYGHYRREPAALAIITSSRPRKETSFYAHKHFGTESVYRYNNLVLKDLDDDELIASENPIDLALYAAKCAVRSKKELQKYRYLRNLLGILGERGWNRDDKRDLLLFLERFLYLKDEQLVRQYTEYRDQLSKEGKIVFIPIGEEKAAREIEERGIEKGIEKGKLEVARNMLANGFEPDIIAKNADLPIDKIRTLLN
jgi:predicted transposase YdaD